MANILKIEETEWQEATAFFAQEQAKKEADPNYVCEIKFSKKNQNRDPLLAHSFIQIKKKDGSYEIVALANRKIVSEAQSGILGEGSFGLVKVAQNRAGDNFAVKIEVRGPRSDNDIERKIMNLLNYLEGEVSRVFSEEKTFKKNSAFEKLYTVTELILGHNLGSEIYLDLNNGYMTLQDKPLNELCKIALGCAIAIQTLHNKGIVHADIKPDNFMFNREGEQILIRTIDYGLSMILPENIKFIFSEMKGTYLYLAPEIQTVNPRFSFASDIYALGILFQNDLTLTEDPILAPLIHSMLNKNHTERPTISEIIQLLENRLKQEAGIHVEPEALKIKKEIVTHSILDDSTMGTSDASQSFIATGSLVVNIPDDDEIEVIEIDDIEQYAPILKNHNLIFSQINKTTSNIIDKTKPQNDSLEKFALVENILKTQKPILKNKQFKPLLTQIRDSLNKENYTESHQSIHQLKAELNKIGPKGDWHLEVQNKLDDINKHLTEILGTEKNPQLKPK